MMSKKIMSKKIMQKKQLANRHISLKKLFLSMTIITLTESMIVSSNLFILKAVFAQNSPVSLPANVLPVGTKVRIDGSQTLAVTNQALKKSFEEKYPGTVVEVAENGIDQGLQELLDGKIDLLAIGRSLTEEEKAQGLVQVPLRREKIAIIIGENNPFQGNLTFEEFARIWRGEITDWSEVGGQTGPIRVVDRPPATSDTRLAFQNYPVFADFPFETGSTAETLESDDINEAISRLGSDGISYAIANQVFNKPGVKIVVMHQTLPDDPHYPFSQPLYYVYKKNQLGAGVPYFLGLVNSNIGQQVIEQASLAQGGLVNSTGTVGQVNQTNQVNTDATGANTGVSPNANGQINTTVSGSNTGISPNANGQVNTGVTGANTGISPNANGQINTAVTGANNGVSPDANGQVNTTGATTSTPNILPSINGQINNASPNLNNNANNPNNPNNIDSQIGNVSDANTNNLNPNNTSGTATEDRGAPFAWLWWLLPLLLGAVGLGWLLTKQKNKNATGIADATDANILEGKATQSSLPESTAKSMTIPPVVADKTEHDDEPTELLTPKVDVTPGINPYAIKDQGIAPGITTPTVFPATTTTNNLPHDDHDDEEETVLLNDDVHNDDEETVLLHDNSAGNLNVANDISPSPETIEETSLNQPLESETNDQTLIPTGIDPKIITGLGVAGLGVAGLGAIARSGESETSEISGPAFTTDSKDNTDNVNIDLPNTTLESSANLGQIDQPIISPIETPTWQSITTTSDSPSIEPPYAELQRPIDQPIDNIDNVDDTEDVNNNLNDDLNQNLAIATGLGVAGLGAVAAISHEVSEPVIESVIAEPEIIAEPIISPEVTEPVIESVVISEPAIAPVEMPESSITIDKTARSETAIGETVTSEIEVTPEPTTESADNTLGLGAVAGLGVAGLGAVVAISNINQDESDLPVATEETITSSVEIPEPVIETVIEEPIINSTETIEPVIESVIVEPAIASTEISEPVIETVIEEPIINSITTEPVVNETAVNEIPNEIPTTVNEIPTTSDNNLLDNTVGLAGLVAIGGATYALTDFTPTENADVPPIAESFTGEISTQKPAIPSVKIEETVIEETPVETADINPDISIVAQTVEESAKATPTEIGQYLDLGIAPVIEETFTSEIVSETFAEITPEVIPEVTSETTTESPDNTLGLGAVAGLGLAGLGAIGASFNQDTSDQLPEEETTTSYVEISESVIESTITEPATTPEPIIESVIAESAKATPTEIGQYLDLGIAPIIEQTTQTTESQITPESLAKVDEVLPELPASYGESRIYLMPRDPHSAYAYWDVLETDKIKLQKEGGRLLALRLYDVTDIDLDRQAPHSMQQYECDEMAKEWFFGVPMSDRDYIVEIGYVTDYGEWLMLARSLPTHIPPLYPSEVTSDQFVTINWFDKLEDKTWQIPQEVLLQPGLPIVQGSHSTVSDSFNRHLTASGIGMSGVGLTASGMGMSGVGLTASGIGYTTSGVGLTASGMGMSGIGLTASGMGYTTSGVGMSGVGMIYTASGIGYSASGIGYTTSGMGLTTSGIGYTTSGVGIGYTTSGIGYTTSGMGLTTSGIGYTTSGVGIGYTTSGVGYSASGIGYTTSGMGLTTSGIGYTTSGMGLTTSGIGYTTSGVGLTTSGIGYTT